MPRNGERGFTLIELLTVMLIIALLAAIGVPIFINQRTRAQDAEAKTAVRHAIGAIEMYRQDNNSFVGATPAALAALEPSLADALNLTVVSTVDTYTVSVDSTSGTNGGGPFSISHTPANTTRNCATPGQGGCPSSGTW
jgi:type IV pilus assembly protein PilA